LTESWPTELSLIRHGQSVGNVADDAAHVAGAAVIEVDVRDPDVELSPLGVQQAEAVGRRWAAELPDVPDVVVSSPYVRALSTARLAIAAAGCSPELVVDERVRERDLGVFDGLTALGITTRFPDEARRRAHLGKFYYRPPSGESWADLALRVRAVVHDIRELFGGKRVAVFSHQAVLFVFRYVLENLTEQQVLDFSAREPLHNGAVTRYQCSDAAHLRLVGHDLTDHLEAEGTAATGKHDVHAEV
jgi:2,3-bisphosphoglycerate-dependent phosphoglycerate mutase